MALSIICRVLGMDFKTYTEKWKRCHLNLSTEDNVRLTWQLLVIITGLLGKGNMTDWFPWSLVSVCYGASKLIISEAGEKWEIAEKTYRKQEMGK